MDKKTMQPEEKEEAALLESKLYAMQAELKERYCELGKLMLEWAETEQRDVNKLVDEIIITRRKLSILRGEKSCDHCAALNDNDSAYCKRCGNKL